MKKQYELLQPSDDEAGNPIFWEASLAFLKYAIAALLAGSATFLVVILITAPDQTARTIGPVAVSLVAAAAWLLLLRGRIRTAINVLAIGAWTVVTGIALFNGGVRAPIVYAYPLIILLIGWLVSLRAALIVAGLTVVTTTGFVLAESWDFLPRPLPTPPAMHGVVQSTIFVISAFLIVFLVRAYTNRLQEIGQRTADLKSREAELNRAQAIGKIGSWNYDIVTKSMRLSAEACRIFGLANDTKGTVEGYLALVHPHDRNTVDHLWQAALKGEVFDHEHRIVIGESVRWVRQKIEMEHAANGTPLRLTGIVWDIGARKQDDKAIAELNRDFVSFLENTCDFIYFKDANNRFRFCSQTLANVTGHASWRDMVGKHALDVMPTDTAQICCEDDAVVFREGKPLLHKISLYYDAAGNPGWISTNKWPLIDHDGKLAGLFCISRDISALKKVEDALRESEAFFRLIAENVGDFIAVLDLEGRRLYNSPSYQQFFGDAADVHGTDSFSEVHPEDKERVKQVFRETARTGIGQKIEYRFVKPDGSIRQMESRGGVIRDSNDRVARVVVVSHDITERKQKDSALRRSERHFRAYFERSMVGMAETSPEKGWVEVNDRLCEIVGLSREALIRKTWAEMTHPDDLAADVAQFNRVLAGEIDEYEMDKRFIHGDGHAVFTHLAVRCVRREDGTIDYLVALVDDISERKQMEDRVHQLAFYDPLTRLPNRRLLNDRLSQTIAASRRSGCYGALMFLDLDNFKPLNDVHGHSAGDLLLVQAADRLKNCVREMDTVARFGGDEFVVVISKLDPDKAESTIQAGVIAEKIRSTLSAPYTLTVKDDSKADAVVEHRCTASIGVTLFIGHETSPDDILKLADTAMYQAKEAGRNLIRFAEVQA